MSLSFIFPLTNSGGVLASMQDRSSLFMGEVFEGSDSEYEEYLETVIPTDEDEDKLINDYMKKEWIQYREWKG